jgi:hypothetical protein
MVAAKTLRREIFLVRSALLLAVVLSFSCGQGGRRPVFPVRGQVLYEDKPTPGALVLFHPLNDSDPQAPRPVARVGADGNFAPTTYNGEDGAPAGEYSVTVAWVKEVDNQSAPREEQREPRNLLPERYSRPETSGLRVHIQQGRNDLPTFRLTRK